MQLSEWKQVPITDSDLNAPLFLPKVQSIEYQLRDNTVIHNRIRFASGSGVLYSQRIPGGWYNLATEKVLADLDRFKEVIAKESSANAVITKIRPLERRRPRRIGYCADVANRSGTVSCAIMKAGFRLNRHTIYDNDDGNVDTIIDLQQCAPDAACDQFRNLFDELAIVRDRETYRMMVGPSAMGK